MAQTEQKIFNVGVVGYGGSHARILSAQRLPQPTTLPVHGALPRRRSPRRSSSHHTPDTHFSLSQQALDAGKHVFVEKPFVPSSTEASELHRLAEEKGLLICVYQNRRWDSDFQTVRKLVSAGTLGRVYEFETHFDRYRAAKPTSWKGELGMSRGGSALYDLGTHLVDQVYVLFGMPRSVSAKLVSQREGRVLSPQDQTVEPDSVNLHLFYDSGLIVYVRIGVMSAETRQARFWVRGTKGSYRKDGLDAQEDQLKAGMTTGDARFGRDPEELHGRLVTVGENETMSEKVLPNVEPVTYKKIYELFGEALRGNGPVPVPASEARDVLRILEAAKESSLTRREVELS
ncbi:hypothetical protein CIB48_g2104 [Xylaria polymorpha]|nr:hypothetical protein CIB48_g2104 [Xylaria polymorpha]